MGVSPSDFNEHSKRIFEDYDDEISRRCAISRGYYYVCLHVREVGRSHPEGDFPDGEKTHKKAKKFCRKIGDYRLANELNELHRRRKEADYELDQEIDEMAVETFKIDAENFINNFKMRLAGF